MTTDAPSRQFRGTSLPIRLRAQSRATKHHSPTGHRKTEPTDNTIHPEHDLEAGTSDSDMINVEGVPPRHLPVRRGTPPIRSRHRSRSASAQPAKSDPTRLSQSTTRSKDIISNTVDSNATSSQSKPPSPSQPLPVHLAQPTHLQTRLDCNLSSNDHSTYSELKNVDDAVTKFHDGLLRDWTTRAWQLPSGNVYRSRPGTTCLYVGLSKGGMLLDVD